MSAHDCTFLMTCRKIGCPFQHPPGFVKLCTRSLGDCKFGARCRFRHLDNAIPETSPKTNQKTPSSSRPASAFSLFKTAPVANWAGGPKSGFPKPTGRVVAHTETKVRVVGCVNRDLFLMLDMSGSMAGGPVRDVRIVCKDVVSSVMKCGDQLELTTFGTRVETPLLPLADYSAPRLDEALNALRPSGMTALWEAVIQAVDRAAEVYGLHKKRFVEVVVMTDGDANSDALFEAACQKVAKPGCVLKFFLISCGSSPDTRAKLARLCGPAHCKLFIEDNVRDLQEAFGKVKRELIAVTTTKTTVLHTDVKTSTVRRRVG